MHFTANSITFEKFLSFVQPVVPLRSPMMSILENIHIDINDGVMTLMASDVDISVSTSFKLNDSDDNVTFLCQGKRLGDTIKGLGDMQLFCDFNLETGLNIQTDSGKYNISTIPPTDFPAFPQVNEDNEITISGEDLQRAVHFTHFAISKEPSRLAISGLLIEVNPDGSTFVATDGHRLVKYHNSAFRVPDDIMVIVPEKTIGIVSKIFSKSEVRITFDRTRICFEAEGTRVISRLIDHKFPDYNPVVPQSSESELKISRSDLLTACRRMLPYANNKFPVMKMLVSTSLIEIESQEQETGSYAKETLDCIFTGEPLEKFVAFKTTSLIDVLSHIEGEEVYLKFNTISKPVLIEPVEQRENEVVSMIMMPTRVGV